MMRYCFAVDLKPDPILIAEYEAYHQAVWPEILDSIRASGILGMQIYRIEHRLFMVMEVSDEFSFDSKQAADLANPKVQEWENLMWKYQQGLPWAKPGEKWMKLEQIFNL
jgi:L-rhamnose mutarotase